MAFNKVLCIKLIFSRGKIKFTGPGKFIYLSSKLFPVKNNNFSGRITTFFQ